jgi:UDP-glucose 4-epimerase
MMMKGKRIVVTGGAGFIGSHLVEELIRRGNHVMVVDDFSSGRHKAEGAEVHIGKIEGDPMKLRGWIKGADFVFHLAAKVGVKRCFEDPQGSFMSNVIGAHNVVEACTSLEIPMLDVSSSSAYGKTFNELSEESPLTFGDPGNPSWQYGLHKAIGEAEARNAGFVAVRLFNVIGPRQRGDYGFVVPKFLDQALKGSDLTVYGDGTQTRSFCDVRDIVAGLILVAEKGMAGQVYNLGSDQEYAIKDLADMIVKLTTGRRAGKINIQYVSRDEAIGQGYEEAMHRKPILEKIYRLGWKPRFTVHEAIQNILEQEK